MGALGTGSPSARLLALVLTVLTLTHCDSSRGRSIQAGDVAVADALPEAELIESIERFCSDGLGMKPLEIVRPKRPAVRRRRREGLFAQRKEPGPDEVWMYDRRYDENQPPDTAYVKIDSTNGIVLYYADSTECGQAPAKAVGDTERAEQTPEREPLSKEEAFAKAKRLLEYLEQPVRMEDYVLIEWDHSTWQIGRQSEHDGIPYWGAGIRIRVKRDTGRIWTVFYRPILHLPEPGETKVTESEALATAKKVTRRKHLWERLIGRVKVDGSLSSDSIEKCIVLREGNGEGEGETSDLPAPEARYCWSVEVKFTDLQNGHEHPRISYVNVDVETGEVVTFTSGPDLQTIYREQARVRAEKERAEELGNGRMSLGSHPSDTEAE